MSARSTIRIVSARCVAVQDSADRLRRILVLLIKRGSLLRRQSKKLRALRAATAPSIIVRKNEACFNGVGPG